MLRFVLSIALFGWGALLAASPLPELVVYTYDSFLSDWGPGPGLKKGFEAQCACQIKWVSAADGAAILARLKIEGKSSKADLVMGIDESLAATADQLDLFIDSQLKFPENNSRMPFKPSTKYIPFDYGFYGFMFDSKAKQKNGAPFPKPTSLDQLLTMKEFRRSLLIQDPRSSAAGLGLLLWLQTVYGNDLDKRLEQLKSQTLTVTKGWSDSYGLFTKGEAPIVFSYTTSEAYHREIENENRYQALIFPEGHIAAVETAAILKTSKNPKLGKQFLEFILTEESQKIISTKNWMYPVIYPRSGLPHAFATIQYPKKTLRAAPDEIEKSRKAWNLKWEKVFLK